MRALPRGEGGQTIILVALSLTVLLGALALALDWGYGLTQRRVVQNAADAAALAAARVLATSTRLIDGSLQFAVSQESLFCAAVAYAATNRASFLPSGAATDLVLQIGDGAAPTTWTDVATTACPAAADGTAVPSGTRYVRAVSGTSYRSLLAAVVGQPALRAEASARARIAGAAVGGGPVWPMVRHYDPEDFDAAGECDDPCDPDTIRPFTFWAGRGSLEDMVYGNFKGLVDYSRFSTRHPSDDRVPQLIAGWDQTGSPSALPAPGTPPKPDQSGNCRGPWDTQGNEAPQLYDKQCSIPNWAYYTFGGTLSLTTNWQSQVSGDQEAPSNIGARSSICSGDLPPGLLAPSCTTHRVGDWVETALTGDEGDNVSSQLSAYIALHGGQGPRSATYGKAVVIYVYLWDCAETFQRSRSGEDQWSLITPRRGSDCAEVNNGAGLPTIDRVHLFTAAPFTFYERLVSRDRIEGFWGGAFGDPLACQADPSACPSLNAFINTAFLVADD